MLYPTELFTPRLIIRQWRPSDLEPFAAMNADAEVMRYYPETWTRNKAMRLLNESCG